MCQPLPRRLLGGRKPRAVAQAATLPRVAGFSGPALKALRKATWVATTRDKPAPSPCWDAHKKRGARRQYGHFAGGGRPVPYCMMKRVALPMQQTCGEVECGTLPSSVRLLLAGMDRVMRKAHCDACARRSWSMHFMVESVRSNVYLQVAAPRVFTSALAGRSKAYRTLEGAFAGPCCVEAAGRGCMPLLMG